MRRLGISASTSCPITLNVVAVHQEPNRIQLGLAIHSITALCSMCPNATSCLALVPNDGRGFTRFEDFDFCLHLFLFHQSNLCFATSVLTESQPENSSKILHVSPFSSKRLVPDDGGGFTGFEDFDFGLHLLSPDISFAFATGVRFTAIITTELRLDSAYRLLMSCNINKL